MEKGFEIIDFLVKDELEAIDGYIGAINKIKESDVPNKEEVIAKLESIKKDEYDHIEILQNIGAKSKFDEINLKRIGN